MKTDKLLQTRITSGRWTLPVVVMLFALTWGLTSWSLSSATDVPDVQQGTQLWQTICGWLPCEWMERLIGFLIYIGIGYLLIGLNNRFAIVRLRASIQTTIFLILITACPMLYLLNLGSVAALALTVSFFFLFNSYQNPQGTGNLFHAFFCIGLGSVFLPQLLLLVPLCMLEVHRFGALSPRGFFAALIGVLLPYGLLLEYAFFYGRPELFYEPFRQLLTPGPFFHFEVLTSWQWVMLLILSAWFITSTVHCFTAIYEDKIQTRSYLRFFIDFSFCLLVFIVLQPQHCNNLLPLLMVSVSVLSGHFFALTHSQASNTFFIVSGAVLMLLFGYNLWTLL